MARLDGHRAGIAIGAEGNGEGAVGTVLGDRGGNVDGGRVIAAAALGRLGLLGIDVRGSLLRRQRDDGTVAVGDDGDAGGLIERLVGDRWSAAAARTATPARGGGHEQGAVMAAAAISTILPQANLSVDGSGQTVDVQRGRTSIVLLTTREAAGAGPDRAIRLAIRQSRARRTCDQQGSSEKAAPETSLESRQTYPAGEDIPLGHAIQVTTMTRHLKSPPLRHRRASAAC